jgi:hypothetical protein
LDSFVSAHDSARIKGRGLLRSLQNPLSPFALSSSSFSLQHTSLLSNTHLAQDAAMVQDVAEVHFDSVEDAIKDIGNTSEETNFERKHG